MRLRPAFTTHARAHQGSGLARGPSTLLAFAIWLAAGTCDLQLSAAVWTEEEHYFYRPLTYGSESQFNPASSFINNSLDAIQIPASFDDNHFGSRAETVWKHLSDPFAAIDEAGGGKNFVNRQLLPIDFDHLDDSVEMIPNYGLHVFGGGMVYRKNAEWLDAHGFPFPRTTAAALSLGSDFINEVIEKKTTAPDDEVADFWIMRPLGIALFSWDAFARFSAETLRLAEWPYQPMFSPRLHEFANVGENWIVRPPLFRTEAHKPFLFFGLTTLLGMSHQLTATDSLSWGVGPAIRNANPDHFEYRWSGGLFYDRNNSLMASLMLNGTENLKARLNVYPGAIMATRWFPGIFFGIGDDEEVSVGLTWSVFPLGISDRFN